MALSRITNYIEADGADLNLQSSDTTITDGSVLGVINFKAPSEASGTDAILLASKIEAVAEGTFSASSNATELVFFTASSEAAGTAGGGKMVMSSTGNLTLKDTRTTDGSSPTITLQTGDTDIAQDDVLGTINFQAPDEGTGTDAILVAAGIAAVSEGDFSSSSNATKLSFKTAASATAAETMSLSSAGNLTVSGDVSVGDDLSLASDSAVLSFGADSEIKLTHSADTGLILKNTNTGDDKPIVLTFQTGETDMQAGDVLGRIDFQAPDEGTGTDAILVAASIEALSEGDFSSSSNATMLSFKTGSSEAATEKFRIESSGSVGIAADGDTSNNHLRLGASADLKIYHDGSNSFINEVGTGDLRITGSQVRILSDAINLSNAANDEDMITCTANGAVNLRHNNVSCLTTTSDGGIDIEGGDIFFSTSGKGINLGVTSNTDSNTLDDYEEGTYTLGMNGFAFQTNSTGRYIKIGKFVNFTAFIHALGSQNTNTATLDLPFTVDANTASSNSGYYTIAMAHVSTHNVDTGSIGMSWVSTGGSSNIILHQQNEDGSRTQAQNNVFTSEDTMYLSGTFIANA